MTTRTRGRSAARIAGFTTVVAGSAATVALTGYLAGTATSDTAARSSSDATVTNAPALDSGNSGPSSGLDSGTSAGGMNVTPPQLGGQSMGHARSAGS